MHDCNGIQTLEEPRKDGQHSFEEEEQEEEVEENMYLWIIMNVHTNTPIIVALWCKECTDVLNSTTENSGSECHSGHGRMSTVRKGIVAV